VTTDDPIDRTIDLTADGSPVRPLRVNGNGNGNGHNGNGSSNGYGSPTPTSAGTGALDGIEWRPAYDRSSVERYLSALDAERERLEGEIADAERRTAAAQQALATRTAELEASLGAVVLAARAELDRIDREQQEAVAAIRADAETEAARIREAARLEADTVREAAASLSALTRHEGRADAG
jgi:hypothetical protein